MYKWVDHIDELDIKDREEIEGWRKEYGFCGECKKIS